MIDLIAIDPGNEGGLGYCACAFFEDGALVLLAHADYPWAYGFAATHVPRRYTVVYEQPMLYPQGHERPNDLIKLGCVGAEVAAAFTGRDLKHYTPAEWKGQKAKPACHLIMWEKLTPKERALFPKDTEMRINKGVEVNAPRMYKQPLKNYSFKAHNLLDACAIGRFHLGLT